MDLQLAKPITLPSGLTLPNRLVKSSMAEQFADKNNLPNGNFIQPYRAWGEGGWGMILTGNVQVDPRHLGGPQDTALSGNVPEAKLLESWKAWASATSAHGTPIVMQISHPGRQSPLGAGSRGMFGKTVSPSAVPLKLGDTFLQTAIRALVFGTPRAMTLAEIRELIQNFVRTASLAAQAGFAGVEIHAAHGYLLASFLSPKTNLRTDEYGGSALNRVRIVVEIIRAVREATPKGFTVGVKFNSVDHQSEEAFADCIEQLEEIRKAGIDFLEISGGTYETPTMLATEPNEVDAAKSSRTKAREAFFLEFSRVIRERFHDIPLLVTGGFRTRLGMEAALEEGGCDMVGLARPAALVPALPKKVIFNQEVSDDEAKILTKKVNIPWIIKKIGGRAVGAGFETMWYGKQIRSITPAKA